MIKVYAIGNLTRDPEMRYTPQGKAVTEFSIASNEGYGEKRTTEYLDCQVWEKLAESVAEHCRKGRKVFIEGRYTTRQWEDKSGNKRTQVRINCNNVEYLDRPTQREDPLPGRGGPLEPLEPEQDDLEGLKF